MADSRSEVKDVYDEPETISHTTQQGGHQKPQNLHQRLFAGGCDYLGSVVPKVKIDHSPYARYFFLIWEKTRWKSKQIHFKETKLLGYENMAVKTRGSQRRGWQCEPWEIQSKYSPMVVPTLAIVAWLKQKVPLQNQISSFSLLLIHLCYNLHKTLLFLL